MSDMQTPIQPPEAALIDSKRRAIRPTLSIRTAAKLAGLSDTRWRQIVAGYQIVSKDNRVPVRAPAETLARMAEVVGVTAAELKDVGRGDAAQVIERPEAVDQLYMRRREGPGGRIVTEYDDRAGSGWVSTTHGVRRAQQKLLAGEAITSAERAAIREALEDDALETLPARIESLYRSDKLIVSEFVDELLDATRQLQGEQHDQAQEQRPETGGQVDSGTGSGPGDEGAPIGGLTMTERVAQIEDEIRSLPGATGEALITHLRDTAAEWDRDHIDEGRGKMPNRGA